MNLIQSHLARALDSAFQGDYHTARNYIFLASHEAVRAKGEELPIEPPPEDGPLQNIHYFDPKTGNDLWDTIGITVESVKRNPETKEVQLSGPYAIAAQLGILPVSSMTASELRVRLVVYSLIKILSEAADRLTDYQECLDRAALVEQEIYDVLLPETSDEEILKYEDDPLSDDYKAFLQSQGQSPFGNTWSEQLISYNVGSWLLILAYAEDMRFDNYVSAKETLDDLDRLIFYWTYCLIYLRHHIVGRQEQVERARDRVNDKKIWDLIKGCLKGATYDEFVDSLDDWWGAKKYVCAVAGLIVGVVEASVGGPAAFISALASAVWTFMYCMIGSGYEIAFEVATCILDTS